MRHDDPGPPSVGLEFWEIEEDEGTEASEEEGFNSVLSSIRDIFGY